MVTIKPVIIITVGWCVNSVKCLSLSNGVVDGDNEKLRVDPHASQEDILR